MDLFESPKSNVPEFSVSQLAFSLKKTLEETYSRIRVRGELSRISIPSSGHLYTSLKDEQAVIDAVCWKGTLSRLPIKPEEGLEVICIGRISTYPARSNYQLIIEHMELAGEGALLKMLEERRKKLASEGLFAEERKRKLPYLPNIIGVVTSPTGSVIRDILHRINDRFPRHVIVWPVSVQGEDAAAQIKNAIIGFNALSPNSGLRPDIIIVARGGGSLEDLLPFSDELVVRAAANSTIPLISAIGHETDTTLIDYAADLRAPTPTGAAEIAVPVRMNLLAKLKDDERRLFNIISRVLSEKHHILATKIAKLGDPSRILEIKTQKNDILSEKLILQYAKTLDNRKNRLIKTAAKLQSPSQQINYKKQKLEHNLEYLYAIYKSFLKETESKLHRKTATLTPPTLRVNNSIQLIEKHTEKLSNSIERILERQHMSLKMITEKLETLSYENILKRGFTIVLNDKNIPLVKADDLKIGEKITLLFKDKNTARAQISEIYLDNKKIN